MTALNGWRIMPKSIKVSDIDMEGPPTVVESLRKAALVWGFNGNDAVNASWDLSGSSLITHPMKIESPALNSLGFSRAAGMHEWLTGVMTTYGDRSPQVPLLRCNTGAEEAPCAATASFDVPVEGFYLMASMEWKSVHQAASLISVGDLQLKCGCRCNTWTATKTITVPTGVAGQCTRRESTGSSSSCSEYGLNWCERKEYSRWVVTGPENDGVYPCASLIGFGAKFVHAYGGPPEPTPSPSPTPSMPPQLQAIAQQQAILQQQQLQLQQIQAQQAQAQLLQAQTAQQANLLQQAGTRPVAQTIHTQAQNAQRAQRAVVI